MNTRKIGTKYETLACEYLKKGGYEIIERNFRNRQGEIDIIAKDKEYLCFIEVKYRAANGLIKGYEAVDKKKQKIIYDVAKYYLYINKLNDDIPCRFDVVNVDGNEISLFKNAFL